MTVEARLVAALQNYAPLDAPMGWQYGWGNLDTDHYRCRDCGEVQTREAVLSATYHHAADCRWMQARAAISASEVGGMGIAATIPERDDYREALNRIMQMCIHYHPPTDEIYQECFAELYPNADTVASRQRRATQEGVIPT